ncbi:hypothetical protein L210DRAFT_3118911 [Boletus edulis BED1]|uniref:Uncharacterized protein n=1 Tax=Boletus edulis BED1 TaxID=1328754 RepID=A0AAD4G882_BOLED|nr:hypothetical protein L210DRAFT_3118911 [Boletus edulis BED1]
MDSFIALSALPSKIITSSETQSQRLIWMAELILETCLLGVDDCYAQVTEIHGSPSLSSTVPSDGSMACHRPEAFTISTRTSPSRRSAGRWNVNWQRFITTLSASASWRSRRSACRGGFMYLAGRTMDQPVLEHATVFMSMHGASHMAAYGQVDRSAETTSDVVYSLCFSTAWDNDKFEATVDLDGRRFVVLLREGVDCPALRVQ